MQRRQMMCMVLAGAASSGLLGRPAAASSDLATLATGLIRQTGSPAAGVALYDGTPDCAVAGERISGSGIAVGAGDLWHIGSITKSMTGTLCARMIRNGQIGWGTTIGDALSSKLPDMDTGFAKVTLEQLLCHRSGMPANVDRLASVWFALRQNGADRRAERLQYAAKVLANPPAQAAGRAYLYSNAGFVVAGTMLEEVGNEAWESLIEREVFTPLGLTTAGFGPPGVAATGDQPRGHSANWTGGLKVAEPGPGSDNPAVLGPAGTVHLSLCDLLAFASAHASRPESFLPRTAWDRLHQDHGDDYALGWAIRDDGGIGHSGSNTLWYARVAAWPKSGRAAVVVTNDGRLDRIRGPVDEVIDSLAP